jgi:hypothetical protein
VPLPASFVPTPTISLIFYEPDVFNDFGGSNFVGAMPFPALVLDFHDYCLLSSAPIPRFAGLVSACLNAQASVFAQENAARADAANTFQPSGPGWFLSEFGASDDIDTWGAITTDADNSLVGSAYWQWKDYCYSGKQCTSDPYGSTDEGILQSDGSLKTRKANFLSQTYARAVAGTPTAMSFDPSNQVFSLTYSTNPVNPAHGVTGPTVVYVPVTLPPYTGKYCATVEENGSASPQDITSPPGASLLKVVSSPGATTMAIAVLPGPCTSRTGGSGRSGAFVGPWSAQRYDLKLWIGHSLEGAAYLPS